ncbi:DNA replication/repair protein RecF [Salinibacterium sp. dk2585]|uniref:DNA replication/repair protein RecF n=1 Tax=unclassified Salinibacterium TaxID=2632331 RepID=UPI0011C24BB5|nr:MULTISPECIES: DNA replication/repair protein RecF [unclassified Salinibacterium]QEE62471.1 DNA replication/repair protein RecF [Salinibacterium sp. dk2585]TXK55186.1 DNA replication/repair protein RecF [Salinibacterium sp. dk5596]
MFVTHLSLTDFRNYERAEVALEPGANLFVGSNGQGKTNLIEALGYLSTVGSHRVSSDQALIRRDQDAAIIRAKLAHGARQLLVEVQLNRSSANKAQVNRSAIKTRELPRYFSSVLFAPEDLALVRGEPSGRRRFMDELLVLLSPRFAGIIADYDRVLRQRNTLLKSARAAGVKGSQLSTLEVWDERLIELGSQLVEARTALVTRLQPEVARAYVSIAGDQHSAELENRLSIFSGSDDDEAGDEPGVSGVVSAADAASAFRTSLERLRRSELERAVTLVGPHRDDLLLRLNGMPARGYASHGESWSFALALKLASVEELRRDSATGDPVLVLDDVFAELDAARRERLADAVVSVEQVLITAAVYEDVPDALRAHTVRIAQGRILDDEVITND